MSKRNRAWIIKETLYAALVMLAVGVVLLPLWWSKRVTPLEWEGEMRWMVAGDETDMTIESSRSTPVAESILEEER